jgi:ABC-2 type transport system ATP-binding protein
MDEAERCHELAILDCGRVVAAGAPERLMREIDATVVEISGGDVRAARETLERLPSVQSVAQLGTRLHALVDPAQREPVAALAAALRAAGVGSGVELARASLEDVFVAATRRSETRSAA